MPLADPHVKFVLTKVGNKTEKLARRVLYRSARHDPAHVGPESPVLRGVGIAFLVGVLVMNAMHHYPTDWPAFQSQCAADRQEVFHPLRSLIAAVRQKSVVAHPDAKTPGDPPQRKRQRESLPCKEKQRCDGTEMERNHKYGCDPIDRLGKRFVALEDADHSLQSCYDFLSARFTPSLRLRGRAALHLGWTITWPHPRGSKVDYEVVARPGELGFRVIDQRKNRKSHMSHRNGLMKIMVRIPRSTTPLRLDRWMCLL